MTIYLVRHAHAGVRAHGSNDKWRPLSDKGNDRAQELVGLFDNLTVDAVYTSPASRCVQTVEPLASAKSLDVIETDALWEDSWVDSVFELIDAADATHDKAHPSLVLCSHGNLIPEAVERLARDGVPVVGRGCEKGSVWVLERNAEGFVKAEYLSRKTTLL